MPPLSKVIPLPTRARRFLLPGLPVYFMTIRRGGSLLPLATARKAFIASAAISSRPKTCRSRLWIAAFFSAQAAIRDGVIWLAGW
jgi:hypothetical protein